MKRELPTGLPEEVMKAPLVTILCLSAAVCGSGAAETAADPAALNREAYLLGQNARQAELSGDRDQAFEYWRRAVSSYDRLRGEFPDWNPVGVAARRASARASLERLSAELYPIPEGYIELGPGLTREGKRYNVGKALAPSVKPLGEGRYEVKGFTVTLSEFGVRSAVACDCPDFKYRGAKFGFPCKHIWAVLISLGRPEAR